MDTIIEAGATHWQIQLTVAMGNAVDNPGTAASALPAGGTDADAGAALRRRAMGRGMTILPGNNIGYFGPLRASVARPGPRQGALGWLRRRAGSDRHRGQWSAQGLPVAGHHQLHRRQRAHIERRGYLASGRENAVWPAGSVKTRCRGSCPDLLLRRRMHRRLASLDIEVAARQAWQQSLLPLPRP